MKDFKSKIVSNEQISKDFYKLVFTKPEGVNPKAGQFLSLKTVEPSGTLLRRPFAFSNVTETTCEIIYQLRGETTKKIATLGEGAELLVLAPVGNNFTINNGPSILIAGGVGLGPMLYLYSKIDSDDKTFISGFRTKDLIPNEDVFPANSNICTDDGTLGFKGNVVDYLKTLDIKDGTTIYCCGPTIMMKYIAAFAKDNGIDCQVSMEEMMGCSIGACMGCVIDTVNGKKRVCKEGPIFGGNEVIWN